MFLISTCAIKALLEATDWRVELRRKMRYPSTRTAYLGNQTRVYCTEGEGRNGPVYEINAPKVSGGENISTANTTSKRINYGVFATAQYVYDPA
jgi:hypothetical protein